MVGVEHWRVVLRELRITGVAEQFEHGRRLLLALDRNQVQEAGQEALRPAGRVQGRLRDADPGAVFVVERLESSGQVDCVAECGVRAALRGAHVADAGRTRVDPDPHALSG